MRVEQDVHAEEGILSALLLSNIVRSKAQAEMVRPSLALLNPSPQLSFARTSLPRAPPVARLMRRSHMRWRDHLCLASLCVAGASSTLHVHR